MFTKRWRASIITAEPVPGILPEQKLRVIVYHQPDAYERIQALRSYPDVEVTLVL